MYISKILDSQRIPTAEMTFKVIENHVVRQKRYKVPINVQ